jgi:hypothetical protein
MYYRIRKDFSHILSLHLTRDAAQSHYRSIALQNGETILHA